MGSGRNRRFGVVPFFLPDIALSSVPSGADTALFACHRTIGRVSAASGGSGTSVRRFPHSILLLRRGWSGHNGCRAVALGSGGVSFVGSVLFPNGRNTFPNPTPKDILALNRAYCTIVTTNRHSQTANSRTIPPICLPVSPTSTNVACSYEIGRAHV